MELPLFSASLGAMGSLARKQDALVDIQLKDEIGKLTARLLKLSKAQDPPHTARYWMKDVRELSYEMQNCVDAEPDWIDKLSGFKARLKAANGRYDRYNLESIPICTNFAGERQRAMVDVQRRPDRPVVGLHDGPFDRVCLLLTERDEQLKVLSIVGVGGIGKTTLVKQLWREKRIGEFDCRAFVRTAKKPDMRRILRSILAQVRPRQPPEASEVHELIRDIREHLQDKRYFLIIDKLWATSVWDVVSYAFPEGNHYSRIVITTEINDVALACCTYQSKYIFKMEPLNFSHSKELFTSGVFGSGEEDYNQLDDATDEIVRRCAGLPLAIITIASALASQEETDADAVENMDQTREFWKWVHNFVYSIIAAFIQAYRRISRMRLLKNSSTGGHVQNLLLKNLPTNTTYGEKMKQVLNLCYYSLPICLQTCLLYLSLFPENYILLKEDIMKLWVAEGFISGTTQKYKMEVAGSYFDKLVNMGLIQRIDVDYGDEIFYYAVHHMVHDFITSKSMEENFITVFDYSQRTIQLSNKVSRMSLQFGSATSATIPPSVGLSQVRSLAFIGLKSCFPPISEFKVLRSLILHVWADQPRTGVDLKPTSELVFLRSLQVTCNDTVYLPDLMQGPKHLETLEINAIVASIPANIVHLRSWLHLRLGVGTELPDLIGILKNVTLNPPILLDELSSPPDLVMTMELLSPIFRIPAWIGQLINLCSLKIVVRELQKDDISNLEGLPSLTVLSLYVQQRTEELISFVEGAFPSLEYLDFRCGVLRLMFWEGAMPNLHRLKLGFNAHRGEQYGGSLTGIEHLKNVKEIFGIIGSVAGAEDADLLAAESSFMDAIDHPPKPRYVSIKRVDMVEEDYGLEGKQEVILGKDASSESQFIQRMARELTSSVMGNTVEATVRVDLFLFEETDFYGKITAHNQLASGEEVRVLFDCEFKDKVDILPSSTAWNVPLTRSVIVWHVGSPLVIKVGCFHTIPVRHQRLQFRAKGGYFFCSTKDTSNLEGLEFSFDADTDKVRFAPLEGFGYICVSVDDTGKYREKPNSFLPRSLTKNEIETDTCEETKFLVIQPNHRMPGLLHLTNKSDDQHVAFQLLEFSGILPPASTSTYLLARLETGRHLPWEMNVGSLKSCAVSQDQKRVETIFLNPAKNEIEEVTLCCRIRTPDSKWIDPWTTIFSRPGKGIKEVVLKATVSHPIEVPMTSETQIKAPTTESSIDQSDLLDVYPLQLRFPFKLNKAMCCPLRLTNRTDDYVIFQFMPYARQNMLREISQCKGILQPKSTCTYVVATQKLNCVPDSMDALSVILKSCVAENITDTDKYISSQDRMHGAIPKDISYIEPIPPKIEILTAEYYILSMDVHPTEPWILTRAGSGCVSILNYQTQQAKVIEMKIKGYWIKSVKFIAREKWFVAGVSDGSIHVVSYITERTVKKFQAHKNEVESLAVHPNQTFVLSASEDAMIKLWNWDVNPDAEWECLQTYEGHIHAMFNPYDYGNTFASASEDCKVKIWSTNDRNNSPKPIAILDCGKDKPRSVAYFSLGGQQYIITGSWLGLARVWDLQTNICIKELNDRVVGVVDCGLDNINPVLVTVSADISADHGLSFLDIITYESRHGKVNFGLGEPRGFAYIEVDSKRSLVIAFTDGIAIMEMNQDDVNPPATMEQGQTGVFLTEDGVFLPQKVKIKGKTVPFS